MESKKQKLKEIFLKHKEVCMYIIFGGLTTIISWLSYSICVKSLEGNFSSLDKLMYVSGVISWVIAVTFAFITNKIWVFESRSLRPSLVLGEFLSFIGGRLLTGGLEIVAVPFLVSVGLDQKILGIDGLFAKIITSVVVVILNYVLSKFISFKKVKKVD